MKSLDLSHFTTQDELLYRNLLLCIPDGSCYIPRTTNLSRWSSCQPLWGRENTELLSRGFWWHHPGKLVKEFIRTCDACVCSKSAHHHPYGHLYPHLIPSRPWASLSMDFITDLPRVGDHDTVLVIVDRFLKMAHFVPCSKTISGRWQWTFFLQMSFDYTAYPRMSLLIEVLNLSPTYGADYYRHSGLMWICQPRNTLKLMAKPKESTKSSNNTSVVQSTTCVVVCMCCFEPPF